MGNLQCARHSRDFGTFSCELVVPRDCCSVESNVLEKVPWELLVSVPRGPRWATGAYVLVEGELPNGYPLWKMKSKRKDVWLFSMADGKWAIGGKQEQSAAFCTTAAFVFCDTPHRGLMPHQMPADWMHTNPPWTLDRDITVSRAVDRMDTVSQSEGLEFKKLIGDDSKMSDGKANALHGDPEQRNGAHEKVVSFAAVE
mmetsp:Transcript_122785/g.393292  ORF Transcript_122785/g.393292 Transcript_122785/m.393292 type:complete len:199 (-) Transcript_122785:77-673(-)